MSPAEVEAAFRCAAAQVALEVGVADVSGRLPLQLRMPWPPGCRIIPASICRYAVQAASDPAKLARVIRDTMLQGSLNQLRGTRVYA